MLFLLSLACLTLANGQMFDVAYSWKQVEFKFPNEAIRNESIASGDYIPENNMPLGLTVWNKTMFVTIPRWKNGVLATLNSFSLNNTGSPVLTPYPDFETNNIHSPDSLVSIFRVRVDSCDRMWGVDTGISDILGDTKTIQPMKLVVIDLKSNQIIRKYTLKDTDLKPESFIADLVVDVVPGQCDKTHVYMSDFGAYGMVVYNWEKNDSWRINHNFFHFDPLNCNFNISGYSFHWTDGVFGMSLSAIQPNGYRTLYFHAMCGVTEFAVSTEVLQDDTLKKSHNYYNFQIVGYKGTATQGPSSVIDPKTCVNYFTQINKNGVACWNTSIKLNPEMFKLVQDDAKLIFPQDLAIDEKSRILYVLANNLPKFVFDKFDSTETNFFISFADLDTLAFYCKN